MRLAIWFQGEDGGQDTLTMTSVAVQSLFLQQQQKGDDCRLGRLCEKQIFAAWRKLSVGTRNCINN